MKPATFSQYLSLLFAPASAIAFRIDNAGLRARQESSTATATGSGSVSAPVPTQTSAPYTPVGGVGVNSTLEGPPVYSYLSDFDFQSLNLALNQEWIELDLFHHGLAQFSVEEFEEAGLDAEDRFLIEWMADQEVGHATMLSNILGENAAKACEYTYPFETVREFVDFCQKLTKWGESGVLGFLPHLDSRPSAELLLQSITTESRQQMIFRQFEGLFPMPVWFETGVPQAFAWTLLAPYLKTCPAENPRIVFQNFPGLNITNNPAPYDKESAREPAISTNRTALTTPGRNVTLQWESPGRQVGYNSSYTTSTSAGQPQFVAWIAQLTTTYTPLTDIQSSSSDEGIFTGSTIQPEGYVFGDPSTAAIVNGTVFVVIVDAQVNVTPFNLTEINPHVVAGPAMYQSG